MRVRADNPHNLPPRLYERPSIDRIVSTEGYTAANVRLVCVAINFALNSWGLEAFLPIAEALVLKHSHSKN